MKEVELTQVSKHFGRHFALHRVDITFQAGELTAIVGANGAGKTTLLNILATLERPSRGRVRYDTYEWEEFARRGRGLIGWVSHQRLLYDDLTGRENLTFYAQMHGLEDISADVERWLDRVGLTDAADRTVSAYSRGMVQRLTIARAMLNDPRLILLDEPLTGLDRAGREDMAELFAELKERQKILVLTTHDLHALGAMCDTLVVLRKGKLVARAHPEDTMEVIHLYETHA